MKHCNIGKIGLVLAFVGVVFFGACSVFSSNDIKIISISPSTDKVLNPGDKMDISVTVKYTLKEDRGRITLVTQKDGKGLEVSLGNITEPIKKGSGKITLKDSITQNPI